MEIYEILSPGGREENMIDYIQSYAKGLGYNCRCDVFGNLICEKGNGIKVAFECGVDNISIMKTAETDKGMIKVAVPNSVLVKSLVGKKIQFLNGVTGVVRSEKSEDILDFDLNVDIGAENKKSAEKAVPTGEFATLVCDKFETESFIFGNGISSIVPVQILLDVMQFAENAAFLFTVQRKFNGRGLRALLEDYEADTIISVNTLAEKNDLSCGKGAVVIIKEKGAVPTVAVRQKLISSTEDEVQLGATEENLCLDLPLICGKGALCGGVCVVVRDKNGAYEAVSKDDIENTEKLLINYLKKVQ